jgi:hypothetical protein
MTPITRYTEACYGYHKTTESFHKFRAPKTVFVLLIDILRVVSHNECYQSSLVRGLHSVSSAFFYKFRFCGIRRHKYLKQNTRNVTLCQFLHITICSAARAGETRQSFGLHVVQCTSLSAFQNVERRMLWRWKNNWIRNIVERSGTASVV